MSQAALPALTVDRPAAAETGRRPHADAGRELPLLNEMTRMQTARGVFRLTLFVLSVLVVLPFQWTLMKLDIGAKIIPFRFHRWLLRVFGIRAETVEALGP